MSAPQLPAGYRSLVIDDIRQADAGFIADYHQLKTLLKADARPGEPAAPLSEVELDVRMTPAEIEDWSCAVYAPDDSLAAFAFGGVERTGDNEHLYWLELDVAPEHRRRGVARWLLAEAAKSAESQGASIIGMWTLSSVPSGEAFARAMELEAKQVNRESELDLTTIDWGQVDRWVAEGPGRAPGYELVLVEGTYPEEHYANVIAWWSIMNTAPRDNLSWNDDNLTAERLAGWEARFDKSTRERWEYIVRHRESGECVGVTNIVFSPWCPEVAHQGDTGVHPDHRGHALGKWLKAAMLQKVRAEKPETRKVRTENAYSNDAMLGINNQLGFAESLSNTIWESPVERIHKILS